MKRDAMDPHVFGCRCTGSARGVWDCAFVVSNPGQGGRISCSMFKSGMIYVGYSKSTTECLRQYDALVADGWVAMDVDDINETLGIGSRVLDKGKDLLPCKVLGLAIALFLFPLLLAACMG